MRVVDTDGRVLAKGGKPEGKVRIPAGWFNRLAMHESFGRVIETTQGKALIAFFRCGCRGRGVLLMKSSLERRLQAMHRMAIDRQVTWSSWLFR
jgi:hypothetical protein